MTRTLIEETPAAPKKLAPVALRSAHDFTVTTQALTTHAEELKKLAKKNNDSGYRREGRAIQADADAIEQQILPVFRDQRELPLVTQDQLEKEINASLRTWITQAFSGLGDPKVQVTPSAIANRRDVLLSQLTKRVTLYVTDVADEAFNQGVAAREQTSEALAMRAINTLRALGD